MYLCGAWMEGWRVNRIRSVSGYASHMTNGHFMVFYSFKLKLLISATQWRPSPFYHWTSCMISLYQPFLTWIFVQVCYSSSSSCHIYNARKWIHQHLVALEGVHVKPWSLVQKCLTHSYNSQQKRERLVACTVLHYKLYFSFCLNSLLANQ